MGEVMEIPDWKDREAFDRRAGEGMSAFSARVLAQALIEERDIEEIATTAYTHPERTTSAECQILGALVLALDP